MIVINAKILLECIYVKMLFLKAGFYNYSETKMESKRAENFGKRKTRTAVSLNFFLCVSTHTTNKQNEMDLLLKDLTIVSFLS